MSGYTKKRESHSVLSDSLQPHGLYSPWNSPGQTTGVGSLSLLHGIFPTQELNPGLPCCRRILYQLSHEGSPCFQSSQEKVKKKKKKRRLLKSSCVSPLGKGKLRPRAGDYTPKVTEPRRTGPCSLSVSMGQQSITRYSGLSLVPTQAAEPPPQLAPAGILAGIPNI